MDQLTLSRAFESDLGRKQLRRLRKSRSSNGNGAQAVKGRCNVMRFPRLLIPAGTRRPEALPRQPNLARKVSGCIGG